MDGTDDDERAAVRRAEGLRAVTKDAGDRWAEQNVESAEARCRRHRRRILEVARRVPAAHVSPAFSCLEIVDTLYHSVMGPDDIFIMSKGHGCLAQYAVLESMGRLQPEAFDNYGQMGARLGAHPDRAPDLGIHASTGSLGHGLGIAAGLALGALLRGRYARVFVLLSDGECQEGSTWEAVMVAANLQLQNLVAVVDANGWGGMERMSAAFPALGSISAKFSAFGWATQTVYDGHSHKQVVSAIEGAQPRRGVPCPRAVVCTTTKGQGVSFMEMGQPMWHYRSPTLEEYERAVRELD